MYRVFFERRPTRPRLSRALYDQLTALPPNTEVNVHTVKETYYNAVFLGYEPPPLIEVGVSCFPFGGGCMIGWLAAYLQATPGTRPVGSHR
ncbi:hypothetical protein D9547_10200, partial [Geobacillus stearothermophilus]